ncbi:MAG: hypothetical protein N2712_02110 [Brevinematales bacterium]|nr:hypothetical protein [Brevinematales bacterium]
MRSKFVIFSLLFFSISYVCSHSQGQSFFVNSFRIINYTNSIPQNPVFLIELDYKVGDANHSHKHDLKLTVNLRNKKQEFTIGENVIFRKISDSKIVLFVPIVLSLSKNQDSISFLILEDRRVIFKTNIVFLIENIMQQPILLFEDMKGIEIPRYSKANPFKFFFIHKLPYEGMVINLDKNITNIVKSYPSKKFVGLNIFEYTFTSEGDYVIRVGNSELKTRVRFDDTPPYFRILNPTNNSVFYRTNRIRIKWTDPVDVNGVNKDNSYLTVSRDGNLMTNILPLVSMNKESLISPYETVYLDLPEGDYSCSVVYFDLERNYTNADVFFRVLPSIMDREKPTFIRIDVEGASIIGKNSFKANSKDVRIFVEVSDGEYGSGVKSIYYSFDGRTFVENVFDNFKHIFLSLESYKTDVKLWLEDFGGNISQTNEVIIFYNYR